ncbi:hypothetical protein ACI2JA_06585 [Alkalihalobacillus sp. NPDC078783]
MDTNLKKGRLWFALLGIVVILVSCGPSVNVTEAYFVAPEPGDKEFLTYSGLSDPFTSGAEVDETFKTVTDGRDAIWMDDYSGRYGPLKDGVICGAWLCLEPASLPSSAYFAEDGYIYDKHTPGIWEVTWDENQVEHWEFYPFYQEDSET